MLFRSNLLSGAEAIPGEDHASFEWTIGTRAEAPTLISGYSEAAAGCNGSFFLKSGLPGWQDWGFWQG